MEKVVKCDNERCGLYFGYSEKKTKCPFCYTPYNAVEEKTAEKPKEKRIPVKSRKETFKIWKNN